VTVRPFKRTELRLSFENVALDTLPTRPILVRDGVTPWLAAGKPLFDNSGIIHTLGSGTTNNRINAMGMQSVFSRASNNATGGIVIAIGATDPSVANIPMLWGNTVHTRGPEATRSAPDNIAGSLADSTVFPLNMSYEGNSTRNVSRSRTVRAVLDQSVYDKVFFQFGYNEERKVQRAMSPANGVPTLCADANLYLPDGRTPNPNVGKYYLLNVGRYRGSRNVQEREDWRMSVSTGLDLEQRGGWFQWLGRHRLSGIATREESRSGSAGYNFKAITPSTAAAGWGLVPARPGNLDDGGIALRAYVDDPRDPKNRGIFSRQLNFDPFRDFTLADGTTVSSFDHPVGGSGTSLRRVLLTSRLAALQSYWWKGRIITTLGWRTDHHQAADFNLPGGIYQPPVDDLMGSFPDFDQDKTGGTRNQGIVVRPLKWLSFHYSKSATFSPGITGLDAYNNLIPGSHGEGVDRGFTLTPFDERIYLRVNLYENTSGPRQTSFHSSIVNASYGGLSALEHSVRRAGAPAPQNGAFDVDREGNQIPYRVTSLQRSTGLEAELIANPTPAWRVSLSVAKSSSEESDIGKSWIQFVRERAPVYVQYADAPFSDTGTQTASAHFPNLVNSINLMQQADGQKVESGREWRVRATTRYSFREGWLKSVSVGGSYLWSSPNVVGYQRSEFPNSFPELGGAAVIMASDINKPIRGNVQSALDLFAGYGRKLYKGRIGWRLQLNVRNALDDDTLLIRQVLSDGTPLQFNLPKPRLFILTNTFTY
jgi:iron complex outermembrane recepter protein